MSDNWMLFWVTTYLILVSILVVWLSLVTDWFPVGQI